MTQTQTPTQPRHRFLPYQQEWILNDAKRSIYVKSRRIGITWAEAFWSVRRRLKHRIDHVFCTLNEKTAQEFIRYCVRFAKAVNIALQQEYIDLNGATSEVLTFPNGARVIVVSSNPSSLRGMGGDLTLDEFDWQENQEALYTAAQPVIQWGGCLRLISTFCPSQVTPFCQITKHPEEKKFKLFKTTLLDAVSEGLAEMVPGDHQKLLPDVEACRAAFVAEIRESCLTEGQYKQEYLCEHSDQAAIVSAEAYDKCVLPGFVVSRDMPTIDMTKCGPLYVGIDVGRSKDNTVVTIIEQGEDAKAPPKFRRVYRTILIRILNGMSFHSQYEIIASLIHSPKVKKCLIESNGIGAGLAEQLESNFPGKAYAWVTTNTNKGNAIERFAGWIAQQRIGLSGDADIKEDILALQRIVGTTGRTTYDGQSKLGHCDSFISGALALEAAEGEQVFFSHGVAKFP